MKLAQLTIATLTLYLSTSSAQGTRPRAQACGDSKDCEIRCTDGRYQAASKGDIISGFSAYFSCQLAAYSTAKFNVFQCTTPEASENPSATDPGIRAACFAVTGRVCGNFCLAQDGPEDQFANFKFSCNPDETTDNSKIVVTNQDYFTAYQAATCPVCTAIDGTKYAC